MNTNLNDRKEQSFIVSLVTGDASFNSNPAVLNNVIGQNEARKKLSFYVPSSELIPPTPTMIFTGSQGLGKSFMAEKMALALDRELVEINCGTIQTAKDFVEGVLFDKVLGERSKTLLLDEAHKLSPEIITTLLTLLAPNSKNKNSVSYKNWQIEYDFTKINTIFATTDAHRIFKPLLNRCVEIYFHLYSNEELFLILEHYLPYIAITCNHEDIAYACRGRGRDAFLLAQNIKRYCGMNETSALDQKGWKEIKNIFGIYPMGLNTQEIELLKIIAKDEPISSNNLAVKMGVNIQNIESEIEVRPRELGLIESGTRGRVLTDAGKVYLKTIK
jgi:Holliday junction resolvasome RuvABC ATP-dependent DNA helicase subunit